MSVRIFLWIVLLSIGHVPISLAVDTNGTKLNLTSDGRILADAKASTLVLDLKDNRRKRKNPSSNCDKLTAAFENHVAGLVSVLAVIVPPGKIDGRYLIGIVSNTSTRPYDYEVCEDFYKSLWKRASSETVANVDELFATFTPLYAMQDSKYIDILDQLPAKVQASDEEEARFAKRYAGQLLARLDPPLKSTNLSVMALVEGYREVIARNLFADLFAENRWSKSPEIFSMSPTKRIVFLNDVKPTEFKAGMLGDTYFGYSWNARDGTIVIITDEDQVAKSWVSPGAYFTKRAENLKLDKPGGTGIPTFVYMKASNNALIGQDP